MNILGVAGDEDLINIISANYRNNIDKAESSPFATGADSSPEALPS